MALGDLEAARAIHAALVATFERERGGAPNPRVLDLVSNLCDRAVEAVNDVDCRVASRGIKSRAALLYSDDGFECAELGPLRGAEALRLQIMNELTNFRGRLDILSRRPPSRPELPALGAKKALRILIVEDNADAATSLYKLLEICGYSVRVASTATQALELAKRIRPDVVLCDIGLPDYDGYALAAALKEDPATASIRLIAVTAYATALDRSRSKQAGFKLHLVKPVDPNTLLQELASDQKSNGTNGP